MREIESVTNCCFRQAIWVEGCQSLFVWGTWSTFLTWGESWCVTGSAGAAEMDFHFLHTIRKTHFNLIPVLSIIIQQQHLPVKSLNGAWTIKLQCDERQGRPQGPGTFLLCNSVEMPPLQCPIDTPKVCATGVSLSYHCHTLQSAIEC